MISNAITLEHFETRMKDMRAIPNANEKTNESKIVVTYCTIGYRSGLEGRRLRDEYNLQGKIMNLDGIVCYTHACSKELPNMDDYIEDVSQSFLVERNKKSTMKIHVFGTTWDCAADRFETTYFSKAVMVWRGIGVGLHGCYQSFCIFYGKRRKDVSIETLAFNN